MNQIDVNGFDVVENYLLYKGEEICGKDRKIHLNKLVEMGLLVYSMKVNATNKLRIRFDLQKFFMRRGLINNSDYVSVPSSIYDKVKKQNDMYRVESKTNPDKI